MLDLNDLRIGLARDAAGGSLGAGNRRCSWRGGKALGIDPDDRFILLACLRKPALFGGQPAARSRQTRLGKRYIRACHFADLEAIAGGAQLLGQEPHIVLAQLNEGFRPSHG